MPKKTLNDPSRRDFVKLSASVGVVASVISPMSQTVFAQEESSNVSTAPFYETVSLKINGKTRKVKVDTRTSLLDVLREQLQLTGSKKGCDHGQCGACTILVNNVRINACLTLAVMHEGDTITTVEGLGSPDNLHPLQDSFVENDSYQCGYCTSGQLCSAIGMLDEAKQGVPSHLTSDLIAKFDLSRDEIKERMSGNLCRCGAYQNIVNAIVGYAGSNS